MVVQRGELPQIVALQHGGAPSCWSKSVIIFRDETVPGRWIYLLAPYASLVSRPVAVCEIISVDDIASLLARVIDAIRSVGKGMLTIDCRLDVI